MNHEHKLRSNGSPGSVEDVPNEIIQWRAVTGIGLLLCSLLLLTAPATSIAPPAVIATAGLVVGGMEAWYYAQ